MSTLAIIVGPIAALLGVAIGGLLSYRIQIRSQDLEARRLIYSERQKACAELLAAIRSYRRYVMTSPDVTVKVVNKSESSKGAIVIEGGNTDIVLRPNEAIARVMVVVQPQSLVDEAEKLLSSMNNLTRRRVELGQGNIPNDEYKEFLLLEKSFAEHVREELSRVLNSGRHLSLRGLFATEARR